MDAYAKEQMQDQRDALTKAMKHFLRAHLYDESSKGYLSRFDAGRAGHHAYPLVSRARDNGFVTIQCEGGERFPYSWRGTTITAAGRAALRRSWGVTARDVDLLGEAAVAAIIAWSAGRP